MCKIDGAMRLLETASEKPGYRLELLPSVAQVLLDYIRGLEKRLEAPLVQGQE